MLTGRSKKLGEGMKEEDPKGWELLLQGVAKE
jgi:hypothetical protein